MNRRLLLVAVVGLALLPASAVADQFLVTLDTSSLSGTQLLAFGLTDGDGVVNNTVSLSAFSFGDGSALGSPTLLNGATGDLTSGVTLSDTAFLSEFAQQFDTGSSLNFMLSTTNGFFSGGAQPDAFFMAVCDSSFSSCYSDDLSGAMLVFNLGGSTPTFLLYGDGAANLPAPLVSAVPEPGTLLLLGSGIFVIIRSCRKRWPR